MVGSLLWLSLGVVLDLGKVVSYAPSMGTPLTSKRGNSLLPEICTFVLAEK